MKYVDSGNGKIPAISLIAILSISLTVNLPGLAISPIMAKLHHLFSNSTELEVQLLTSLPNLVIIPFVLLSGRLATGGRRMLILGIGLSVFLLAGILYFFADSMMALILLGCLLGIGCGFVIPLAASLIAIYFTGDAGVRALGMKSGTSNAAVIVATLFVGWVAAYNWHLSFIVYLTPVIPLLLIPFMTKKYILGHSLDVAEKPVDPVAVGKKLGKEVDMPARGNMGGRDQGPTQKSTLRRLFAVIGLYIVLTYSTTAVSYCLPFTMDHYHLDTGSIGVATAMFFLSATLAGFALPLMIRICKSATIPVSVLVSGIGLFMVALFHTELTYFVGVFLTGYGYGIVQPLIYDKTTAIAPTKKESTQYFAYVLTGNYIAISIVPFFIKLMAMLFHTTTEASPDFAFWLNSVIMALTFVISVVLHKKYVFTTRTDDYVKKTTTGKSAAAHS